MLPAIRAREDKNREFLTSEQMPQKELRVGETVWGVATWQDVDPNNVWFSVYVEGLTNAYKFADDPAKYAAYQGHRNGLFREIRTKVLKLNFWRPGDEFTVKESQVRTGVPELQGGPPSSHPTSGFGGEPSRRRIRPFHRRSEWNGIDSDSFRFPE